MESTTIMSTPPDQVDNLIQMVADEAGLQWKEKLDTPAVKQRSEAKPEEGKQLLVCMHLVSLTLRSGGRSRGPAGGPSGCPQEIVIMR